MALLSDREAPNHNTEDVELFDTQSKPERGDSKLENTNIDEMTPRHTVRRFQSQPQLTSGRKRRRHFSFEPGEDFLQALKEDLTANDTPQLYYTPSKSSGPTCGIQRADSIGPLQGCLTSPYQVFQHDLHNASKIPSPVQVYGSVRREGSVSSLQSVKARSNDGRHNSQSSIMTAFRDNPSMNLRPASSSRSSSFNNLRSAEMSPSSKDRPVSLRVRNGVATLSSADHANSTAVSQEGSPARSNTKPSVTSSLRASRTMGPLTTEPSKSD